jgi:hypothetical protein
VQPRRSWRDSEPPNRSNRKPALGKIGANGVDPAERLDNRAFGEKRVDWSLAYFELGLFTGFSAGLLGIGGGLVMVPTLAIIFAAQPGFPPEQTLHMALGTLMATILLTSLANLRTHPQYGAVLWKVVRQPPRESYSAPRSVRCSLQGSRRAPWRSS